MRKLGVKYDGCQEVIDSLTRISNCTYLDLAEDLREVLSSLNSLKNKPSTGNISSAISNAEENAGKLREFTAGLQSYAEKLYEFDNTFYSNFVLLDGTNYDKYQSNISSISISDKQIKSFMRKEDKKSLEGLLTILMRTVKRDLASSSSIIKSLEKEIGKFKLSPENNKAVELIFKGNSYEIKKVGFDKYITLTRKNLDPTDIEKCAEHLSKELGILDQKQLQKILSETSGKGAKKAEKFVERLMSESGAKIYDGKKNKFTKYAETIMDGEYGDLSTAIKGVNQKTYVKMLVSGKDAAIDDLLGEVKYIKDGLREVGKNLDEGKMIKNINKSSVLNFTGKAVGVWDKINTINDNINDNLKDECGDWNITGDTCKEFTVDTAVDLGISAGTAAAGAAIGSAVGSIVPGVGTVIGAGVGIVIGIGLNKEWIGDPPQSLVDKTKEIANKSVDKIGDYIGKIFW